MASIFEKDSLICFIVNPVSGNGKATKNMALIEKYLITHKINYRIIKSEYNGHTTKLVSEIVKERNIGVIVAVGGDGTLSEVINGLYPSEIPLGFIPSGTGNDYAKEMGISKDPIKTLKRILENKPMEIDIGTINNTYFINVASMGFDGIVAQYANQSILKKYLGKLVYVFGVIKALWSFKPREIILEVDGKAYKLNNVWLIAIANNRYYGGGMKISPHSKNDDGKFEIIILKDITRLQLLKLFPTIFYGGHINYRMVETMTGSNIVVKTDEELVLQNDGEITLANNVEIKNIKKGIRVL